MPRYAIAVLLLPALVFAPPPAAANEPERLIPWEGLSEVVGQKVRIAMPDGARIEGKATAVEADALAVEISKTSNKSAYPKGRFLVPRAILKAVDVEHPTKQWRIVCVAVGAVVGVFFALLSVTSAKGGFGAASAGFGAAAGGMPVVGYLIGNAADRRAITYVITP